MAAMGKYLSLCLVAILAVSSLLMVMPSNAQTIPKPSVPEFTLKYVDNSYDVPPTTSTTTDPYTGKQTTTTQAGYRIYNQSIYVVIKNQPFVPYNDNDGHYINLAYTIRWKGHYSDSWNNLPNRTDYYGVDGYWSPYDGNTTIVFGLNHKENPINIHGLNRDFDYDYFLGGVSANGTVDFQIQAFIGYSELVPKQPTILYPNDYYLVVTGQLSDWSNIESITIPDGSISTSTSPTSNPTPTPTVPELSWLLIVPLLLSMLSIALIVKHRKTANFKQ
jgi:hypothetical protein